MTVALALDLLLVALLAATVVYAVLLNRRLAALRAGNEELKAAIAEFTAASEKAHHGMAEMRAAGETTGRALEAILAEAGTLRDDLGFLVERGAAVADRLEHDARAARARASAPAAPEGRGVREDRTRRPGPPAGDDPVARLRRILEATR